MKQCLDCQSFLGITHRGEHKNIEKLELKGSIYDPVPFKDVLAKLAEELPHMRELKVLDLKQRQVGLEGITILCDAIDRIEKESTENKKDSVNSFPGFIGSMNGSDERGNDDALESDLKLSLRVLNFSNARINNDALLRFAESLKFLRKLEVLQLRQNPFYNLEDLISKSYYIEDQYQAVTQKRNMAEKGSEKGESQTISVSSYLQNLQELDLYNNRLSQNTVSALLTHPLGGNFFQHTKNLEVLNLYGCKLGSKNIFLLFGDIYRSTEFLTDRINRVSIEAYEVKRGYITNKDITQWTADINVDSNSSCQIEDKASPIYEPINAGFRNLRSLYLGQNNINSDGMIAIERYLPFMKRLQVLDLSYNQIEDEGIESLANGIQACINDTNSCSHYPLSELGLQGNPTGREAFALWPSLIKNTSIIKLTTPSNNRYKSEMQENLQKNALFKPMLYLNNIFDRITFSRPSDENIQNILNLKDSQGGEDREKEKLTIGKQEPPAFVSLPKEIAIYIQSYLSNDDLYFLCSTLSTKNFLQADVSDSNDLRDEISRRLYR